MLLHRLLRWGREPGGRFIRPEPLLRRASGASTVAASLIRRRRRRRGRLGVCICPRRKRRGLILFPQEDVTGLPRVAGVSADHTPAFGVPLLAQLSQVDDGRGRRAINRPRVVNDWSVRVTFVASLGSPGARHQRLPRSSLIELTSPLTLSLFPATASAAAASSSSGSAAAAAGLHRLRVGGGASVRVGVVGPRSVVASAAASASSFKVASWRSWVGVSARSSSHRRDFLQTSPPGSTLSDGKVFESIGSESDWK